MKKNISKKLAAGMAVGMGALSMMGGVAPIFADPIVGVSGEQADIENLKGTITATGVTEEGVTVKAYQLVDGYYDNNNLIKYVLADPDNGAIANVEAPTAAEITAIANNIGLGNFVGEVHAMTPAGAGKYTADVEPGLYLILVTGSTDTVYNPAIVAVNVNDATSVDGTKIESETVDLNSAFEVEGTAAYIKSSKSSMDKNVVNNAGEDATGDTAKAGETIYYKLDNMTIPSFSADYEHPVYRISDYLEAGVFNPISTPVVKVNGEVLPSSVGEVVNYTMDKTDSSFVISFTETYLRAHAADAVRPAVEITYEASLKDNAGMNFAENVNHAKLEYSNNPNDETSMKTIVKNSYSYTFAINGSVDGDVDSSEDGKSDIINKIEYKDDAEGRPVRTPLGGATFTLATNEDLTENVKTALSDEFGRFLFDGLDVGVYYIKETEAPEGYALNDNMYKVTIAADIDEATGIMKQYSIVTQAKASNGTEWEDVGSMVITNDLSKVVVDEDGNVTNSTDIAISGTTVDIVNSHIQSLPSTGGAGVAMAFGVSAGLAVTAGGIAVTAKKKSRD